MFDEVSANCDAGVMRVIFLGVIIHNNPTICYVFPSVFSYIVVEYKNHCTCAFHPVINPLSYPEYHIYKVFDPDWSEFWGCYELSVLHGDPCFLINDCIGHFDQIVMLCYWLGVSSQIFMETVGYQVCYVLQLITYTPQPSWYHLLYYYIPPCIGSDSTLGGV